MPKNYPNATPQDVPEPSGAEASRDYKPEQLGSGIRVAGDEIMRGVRRIGQDLGIAKDPNQYKKTPQGEAIANSDAAKGARNYVRMYKEGLGMKGKNDEYEKKKGGVIKSASSRADGIAKKGKTRGKMC